MLIWLMAVLPWMPPPFTEEAGKEEVNMSIWIEKMPYYGYIATDVNSATPSTSPERADGWWRVYSEFGDKIKCWHLSTSRSVRFGVTANVDPLPIILGCTIGTAYQGTSRLWDEFTEAAPSWSDNIAFSNLPRGNSNWGGVWANTQFRADTGNDHLHYYFTSDDFGIGFTPTHIRVHADHNTTAQGVAAGPAGVEYYNSSDTLVAAETVDYDPYNAAGMSPSAWMEVPATTAYVRITGPSGALQAYFSGIDFININQEVDFADFASETLTTTGEPERIEVIAEADRKRANWMLADGLQGDMPAANMVQVLHQYNFDGERTLYRPGSTGSSFGTIMLLDNTDAEPPNPTNGDAGGYSHASLTGGTPAVLSDGVAITSSSTPGHVWEATSTGFTIRNTGMTIENIGTASVTLSIDTDGNLTNTEIWTKTNANTHDIERGLFLGAIAVNHESGPKIFTSENGDTVTSVGTPGGDYFTADETGLKITFPHVSGNIRTELTGAIANSTSLTIPDLVGGATSAAYVLDFTSPWTKMYVEPVNGSKARTEWANTESFTATMTVEHVDTSASAPVIAPPATEQGTPPGTTTTTGIYLGRVYPTTTTTIIETNRGATVTTTKSDFDYLEGGKQIVNNDISEIDKEVTDSEQTSRGETVTKIRSDDPTPTSRGAKVSAPDYRKRSGVTITNTRRGATIVNPD